MFAVRNRNDDFASHDLPPQMSIGVVFPCLVVVYCEVGACGASFPAKPRNRAKARIHCRLAWSATASAFRTFARFASVSTSGGFLTKSAWRLKNFRISTSIFHTTETRSGQGLTPRISDFKTRKLLTGDGGSSPLGKARCADKYHQPWNHRQPAGKG